MTKDEIEKDVVALFHSDEDCFGVKIDGWLWRIGDARVFAERIIAECDRADALNAQAFFRRLDGDLK